MAGGAPSSAPTTGAPTAAAAAPDASASAEKPATAPAAPAGVAGTPPVPAPPTVIPPPPGSESATGSTTPGVPPTAQPTPTPPGPRQPWELVEEILNILKTAFPLLALSMEKMVDQINSRGKPPQEEDIYRFLSALLLDGTQVRLPRSDPTVIARADDFVRVWQQYITRSDKPNEDDRLGAGTRDSLLHFTSQSNISPQLKKTVEEDLLAETSLKNYLVKLQRWRDKYESSLDRRPRKQALDQGGCYLTEFHHGKFDEIEVPGQYLQVCLAALLLSLPGRRKTDACRPFSPLPTARR
jgi:transformation/transcription domain-associated protein